MNDPQYDDVITEVEVETLWNTQVFYRADGDCLSLRCDRCKETLCDVEDGDSLATLALTVLDHEHAPAVTR